MLFWQAVRFVNIKRNVNVNAMLAKSLIFVNSFRRKWKHPLFGPTYDSKLPPLTMPQLHSQCEILLHKEIFQQSFIKTILGKKMEHCEKNDVTANGTIGTNEVLCV